MFLQKFSFVGTYVSCGIFFDVSTVSVDIDGDDGLYVIK